MENRNLDLDHWETLANVCAGPGNVCPNGDDESGGRLAYIYADALLKAIAEIRNFRAIGKEKIVHGSKGMEQYLSVLNRAKAAEAAILGLRTRMADVVHEIVLRVSGGKRETAEIAASTVMSVPLPTAEEALSVTNDLAMMVRQLLAKKKPITQEMRKSFSNYLRNHGLQGDVLRGESKKKGHMFPTLFKGNSFYEGTPNEH